MSSVLEAPAAPPGPVVLGRGSLLRAEARRLRSRRTVLVLLVLAALGFLAVVAIASTQYSQPSAAVLADAAERRQGFFEQQQAYREQCLADPSLPSGVDAEDFCGPALTLEEFGRVEDFIDEQPFRLAADGLDGLVAVSAATAVLAFLVGATYVGAEWSTRSMVALLFWEPRRLKVMGTKLAVLAGACALLGAAAVSAWLLAARGLHALHGTTVPAGTWGDLAAGAGRGVLFVVLVGLLGFGVANLVRNTAAAFGLGFVYFVIVENVVRQVRPAWQEYLLSTNAGALLSEGGQRIFLPDPVVDGRGVFSYEGREVVLSNLHGAGVLTVVVLVVVAAGVLLFARRDLG